MNLVLVTLFLGLYRCKVEYNFYYAADFVSTLYMYFYGQEYFPERGWDCT